MTSQSNYSIPSELSYTQLSQMYPSRKMELRRQPFNASTFTENSMIQINLPKTDRGFLNCATTGISYQLNFDVTTVGDAVAVANHVFCLLSSAYAPFRRYVVKPQSGGSNLDEIDNVNVLAHKLMDLTLNPTDKLAMSNLGFNQTNPEANVGYNPTVAQAANIAGRRYSATFNIPLIGTLGSGSDKFIPLGVSDLEIDLTLDSLIEFTLINVPATAAVAVSISNVEFIGEVLVLEETGYQQMLQMYPNGMNLKSQSWSYSSGGVLAAQANGTNDLVVPFSLSSLKTFIWSCQPTTAWDRKFAGVNPNLTSYALIIGGQQYPIQGVNCQKSSDVVYQNSKSFGAFYSSAHSGTASRNTFPKASTANGGGPVVGGGSNDWVAFTGALAAVTGANAQAIPSSNKCNFALDLEQINQSKMTLYNGIPTRGSTNQLRLNIGSALANVVHNIHMWAGYDTMITFDWKNNQILYSN